MRRRGILILKTEHESWQTKLRSSKEVVIFGVFELTMYNNDDGVIYIVILAFLSPFFFSFPSF